MNASSDGNMMKRLGWGCVAIVVLLAVLIIVAAKMGYFRVVQDLSVGGGAD